MKCRDKVILILFIVVAFIPCLYSQSLTGTLNGAYRIDKQATGYSIYINYIFNFKKEIGLNIGIGQTMTTARRPKGMEGYDIDGIRDFKNLNPYNANYFTWTDEQFPGINLPTKDNKYFKLDLLIAIDNLIRQGKFNINPGLVISYKDVQEIVSYIKAKKIDIILIGEEQDKLIPVYNYTTYIDIGAVIQLQYKLWSYGRLDIGLNSMIMYYPISSQVSVQLGAVFEINMDK